MVVSPLASKCCDDFVECLNELSAHLAVRHPDVALPDVALLSVLTTRYCISKEWLTVQHQICSTLFPFDLRCESVTCSFVTIWQLLR